MPYLQQRKRLGWIPKQVIMWMVQKPRRTYTLKEEQIGFGSNSEKPLPQVKSSYYETDAVMGK